MANMLPTIRFSQPASCSSADKLKSDWLKAHGGNDRETSGTESGLGSIKQPREGTTSSFIRVQGAPDTVVQEQPYAANLTLAKIRVQHKNDMMFAWLQVLGMSSKDVEKLSQDRQREPNHIRPIQDPAAQGVDTSTIVTFSGTAGDDAVSVALDHATMQGDDGNDWLEAYSGATLDGGAGNDVLHAYYNANLSGGSGNDLLCAYDNSILSGGDGNDVLIAYRNSILDGGAGDDIIDACEHSIVDGGEGDDCLGAGAFSTIFGGDGNDSIEGGDESVIDAGRGDDRVFAWEGVEVTGGQGNDLITFEGHSTLNFNLGDGHDRLKVSSDGATIKLGEGFSKDKTSIITRENNTIKITFNGGTDSIEISMIESIYYSYDVQRPFIDNITLKFFDGNETKIVSGDKM